MITDSSLIERTQQWWKSKAGFLISVLSLCLAAQGISWQIGLPLLGWAVVAILSFGTLGHFINDWSDIDMDRKAGRKYNLASGLSLIIRWLVLFLLITVSIIPWILGLPSNGLIQGLLLLQFALFYIYSIPPFRLRRFPIVALFLDATYAYVNPAVLLWMSFSLGADANLCYKEIAAIAVCTLAIGLRNILNHHAADKVNDLTSGTPNLAVQRGEASLLSMIRFLLQIEVIAAIYLFVLISGANRFLGIILILAYAILVSLNRSERFPFVKVHFGELAFDRFNSTCIGLISLVYLSFVSQGYLIALIGFILLFTNISGHPLVKIVAGNLFQAAVKVAKLPLQSLSLIFNWGLYYFRKWFLGWPEERNWGKHYAKHLEEKRLDAKGNIAFFNQNYNKYSETFINGQLNTLDYRTFFYYGWPKPLSERKEGNLVSGNEYLRGLKYSLLHFLNRDTSQFEDNLIADSLLENDIKLIIAHFGPMGAVLTNVSKLSGIPMLVIFHGYDAWNKKQLAEYEMAYKVLFSTASCVIGVSQDICLQLQNLGCPKEKIEYLPAYVNLDLFSPSGTKPEGTRFLSVGRFSKTKSPMNVILAFHRSLVKLPEAKLIMVGQDDGEGLFEACHMLVRTLGIEDKVEFKGALSPHEVRTEMQNATIFVQHSVTTPLMGDKEGTPVGIMEAMAMALPIIATRHAGIAELITDGESGLLISEYDVEKMAEEMVRLAGNSDLRKRLGENASKMIQVNKLISRSLEEFLVIIDKHKLKG